MDFGRKRNRDVDRMGEKTQMSLFLMYVCMSCIPSPCTYQCHCYLSRERQQINTPSPLKIFPFTFCIPLSSSLANPLYSLFQFVDCEIII